jgi:hypothetical protein
MDRKSLRLSAASTIDESTGEAMETERIDNNNPRSAIEEKHQTQLARSFLDAWEAMTRSWQTAKGVF